MATVSKYDNFTLNLMQGHHDFDNDVIYACYTSIAPTKGHILYSEITGELPTGNGYTHGGIALTKVSLSQTGGKAKLVCADPPTLTATGAVGPFRYVIFYNGANNRLIGYADNGEDVSLNNTQTFKIDLDQSAGFITL